MLANQNNVISLNATGKCKLTAWRGHFIYRKTQQILYYLTYTRASVKGHLVIFQGRNKSAASCLHLLSVCTFSSLLRTVLAFFSLLPWPLIHFLTCFLLPFEVLSPISLEKLLANYWLNDCIDFRNCLSKKQTSSLKNMEFP